MAKIERHKDKDTRKELDINLDTGDVSEPKTEAWPLTLRNMFIKCANLVEQITERKINIIDETNITSCAYSLVTFGDRGNNLFTQVCLFQTQFDSEYMAELWREAEHKSKKKPGSFIRICREKGLDVIITEDENWTYLMHESGKTKRDITDELTERDLECIREYSHMEYNNSYYFAKYERDQLGNPDKCILEKRSNFILEILYHITRGKANKRVVVLKNNRGREVVLDVETVQITSFNKFKEVTEGSGNFLFEGTQLDLMKIKNKLFEQEKPCIQIDTLGWNKKGFFTFNNGIFNKEFRSVDKYGIVHYDDQNYFIPYHPGTDEGSNINEKKFTYSTESTVTWAQWAPLYYKTFGPAAMPCLVFGVATLYSDAIFSMKNNFPLIFLYGEGGSGKGTVISFLQHLFGHPQPALKLSEKANTDKAKIRKLAQFVNSIAFLEEYINDVDMSVKKTITGIWDRLGYERGTIESKFSTEIVPIQSTVMVTGNEIPDDDPLIQRLILIDYNTNIRTDEVVKNFDKLKQLNRQGLTPITGRLLQYRDSIILNFDKVYREEYTDFKKHYKGPSVPDRMLENNAVLLAVFKIIKSAGCEWPFTFETFRDFLLATLVAQAEKRDTGAVIQRFWDIVLGLLNKKLIRNGREIKVDGSEVSIRFKEVHMLYLEEHSKIYRVRGMASNTLMQKLKDSPAFKKTSSSDRFSDDKVTSSFKFDYDKVGVDLLTVIDYQAKEAARWAGKEEKDEEKKAALEQDQNLNNQPSGTDDLPF